MEKTRYKKANPIHLAYQFVTHYPIIEENFSEEPNNVHSVDTTIKPKLSIIDDP